MKYERYQSIYYSREYTQFEFVSKGPRGDIIKIAQFTQMEDDQVYNLAFGNKKEDGGLDDNFINDNKDRDKILATIAYIIFLFTTHHPDKYIMLIGSNRIRNRLYRMAINVNFNELNNNFEIHGLLLKRGVLITRKFESNKEYHGFLVKRKIY